MICVWININKAMETPQTNFRAFYAGTNELERRPKVMKQCLNYTEHEMGTTHICLDFPNDQLNGIWRRVDTATNDLNFGIRRKWFVRCVSFTFAVMLSMEWMLDDELTSSKSSDEYGDCFRMVKWSCSRMNGFEMYSNGK